MTVLKYANRIAKTNFWGGAIEMMIFAHLKECDVKQWGKIKQEGSSNWVYVREAYFRCEYYLDGDKRDPDDEFPTINIVMNRTKTHYDVVIPRDYI